MSWLDYGSLKGGFSLFQKRWRNRDYHRPDFLTYVGENQPDRLRLACWQSLIVLLNDANARTTADLNLNLVLWLNEGTHRVSRYDADGRLISQGKISVERGRASILKGRLLNPGDMEIVTIS